MTLPHPQRYPDAFRSQLARLERLSPGITHAENNSTPTAMFIDIEHSGATSEELACRNQRLRHMESLIADWRIDGETVYQVQADESSSIADSNAVRFIDVPPSVSYVEFEASPHLRLEKLRGRVEGFYMREIACRGAFSVELTFVCEEPGWRTMDSCTFADALGVGSRICVAIVPIGEDVSVAAATRPLESDPLLTGEPALRHALSLAATFAASDLWKKFKFR